MSELELNNKFNEIFKELDDIIPQIKEKYNPEIFENKLSKLNEKIQALESKLNQENEIPIIKDSLNELRQKLNSILNYEVPNDILADIKSLNNRLNDIDSKILDEKNIRINSLIILDKNQSGILNDIGEIRRSIDSLKKTIESISQVKDEKAWNKLKELESHLFKIEAEIKEVKKPNETINDKIVTLEKKVKTATDAIYSKLNYEVERLDKKENSIKPEINIERLIKLEDENKAAANTILNLNDEIKRINSKMENIKGTNIYKWLTIVSLVLLLLLSSFFYYWCCSQVKALKDEIFSLRHTHIEGKKNPTPTPEPKVIPPNTIVPEKTVPKSIIHPKTNMEYVEFAIKYKSKYLPLLDKKLLNKVTVEINNKQFILPKNRFINLIRLGKYDSFKILHVGDNTGKNGRIPGVMFSSKK